jgi:hypothetical protein
MSVFLEPFSWKCFFLLSVPKNIKFGRIALKREHLKGRSQQ